MFRRLSRLFVPLRKFKPNEGTSSVDLLTNYGYLRQSSAGVYNLLPLGNLVQGRIEAIIRTRLDEVECAESALCTLASTKIWKASGRLDTGKEFFMVKDENFLLAPTNEEEITSMITELSSYKQVPLRLYQISRKYRNEKRPRGGLLRGREFTMKDLYSFDESKQGALKAYEDVQGAYDKIFSDIGLKFEVAEADSGSIGGSLSHEYHYLSSAGEDSIVSCHGCGYTANMERAKSLPGDDVKLVRLEDAEVRYFATAEQLNDVRRGADDHLSVIATLSPPDRTINTHLLKDYLPNPGSDIVKIDEHVLEPMEIAEISLQPLVDVRVDFRGRPEDPRRRKYNPDHDDFIEESVLLPVGSLASIASFYSTPKHIPIVDVEQGETCPSCESSPLTTHQAIEVGHTFYLGTKYSAPLNAKITTRGGQMEPLYMGCYGIGVSRLISAITEVTSDREGLVWPKSVTPFDAVIVSTNEEVARSIHEELQKHSIRSVWDDRSNQFGVLLANARGTGFPLAIIAGKNYKTSGLLEIQVRNKPTDHAVQVSLQQLASTASSILDSYRV